MWGTSSLDDKLTGDLGNVIDAAQIGVRQSDRLTAGKSSPGNFGLLQQYLPCHEPTYAVQQKNLIRSLRSAPYQERFRDRKAKRLRSFEIDHQLEFGRTLDGQLGGVRAPKNASDVARGLRE